LFPYISNTKKNVQDMLKVIGVSSIDDLFADIKPRHKPRSFHLPQGKSEFEVVEYMKRLASKNVRGLIRLLAAVIMITMSLRRLRLWLHEENL